MARRIWVKNPRVKGGGYYRTIKGLGYKKPRIVKDHVPVSGRMLKSGGTRLTSFRKGDKVVVTGRRMTGGQTQSDFGGDLIEVRKGKVRGYVSPHRVHRVGDKQPKTTRPPKSRKPKKTGKVDTRTPHMKIADRAGGKRTGTAGLVKKASGKRRRISDIPKGNKPGTRKAMSTSSGRPRRQLNEKQKAAKRARAKARRAKRRK